MVDKGTHLRIPEVSTVLTRSFLTPVLLSRSSVLPVFTRRSVIHIVDLGTPPYHLWHRLIVHRENKFDVVPVRDSNLENSPKVRIQVVLELC